MEEKLFKRLNRNYLKDKRKIIEKTEKIIAQKTKE